MTTQTSRKGGPAASENTLLSYLLSVSKSVRQLVNLKLAGCEVTAGQDQFLLCFLNGESVAVAEIADRLSVRASTVSKMIDILERKGWVGRRSDDGDARKVLIHLTASGCTARDEVRVIQAKLEEELWGLIGENADLIPALVKLEAVLAKRLSRLR